MTITAAELGDVFHFMTIRLDGRFAFTLFLAFSKASASRGVIDLGGLFCWLSGVVGVWSVVVAYCFCTRFQFL